jgi:hypothetical protein
MRGKVKLELGSLFLLDVKIGYEIGDESSYRK